MSVFFLVFIVWGLILFINLKVEKEINENEIRIKEITEYEPKENYYVSGKSIKNENIGLDLIIPENWKTEKVNFKDIFEIRITSPDFEPGIIFPKKGCETRLGAVYFLKKETKPEIIKEKIKNKDFNNNLKEIIFIDNSPALKTIKYEDQETGTIITVEKPFNNENGLYFFNTYFSENEKNKCLNHFNDFLKSISIKQAPL